MSTIVIYRIGHLGDTLISLPAIDAIRRQYPHHRLVVLTNRVNDPRHVPPMDVLAPTGLVDDTITYDVPSTLIHTILTMLRLSHTLRRLSPQILFDLSPSRSRWQRWRDRLFFSYLAGIADYRRDEGLQRQKKGGMERVEAEWRRLLRIVNGRGEHSYVFPISQAAQEKVSHLNGQPMLAIAPGSKMSAKRWPLEHFSAFGCRILSLIPDCQLIILGNADERGLGETLSAAWGNRAHNLSGTLSLTESAAILARCKAYVGNDTGTMHLAALTGTPCVALFSARDLPGKWEPMGTGHVVLRQEISCQGCMCEICPHDNACLRMISVDEVVAHTLEVISRNSIRRAA
jgi:ADP-heptose:LPS heptosyltransferase